jgi:hypothetical protein
MPTATRCTLQVQAFIGSGNGKLALQVQWYLSGRPGQKEAFSHPALTLECVL